MEDFKRLFGNGTLKQWACLSALFLAGFAAFLLLVCEGECRPDTILWILAAKLLGLAILAACCVAGKWLDEQGLLPETEEE